MKPISEWTLAEAKAECAGHDECTSDCALCRDAYWCILNASYPSSWELINKGGKQMTGNEYQCLALRTASSSQPYDHILNGVMGLNCEAGECIDIVKKNMFQGHTLDIDKLIDELGDVLWYVAITADGIGVQLEDIMQHNIDKLRKRYPDGFDAERSINRED